MENLVELLGERLAKTPEEYPAGSSSEPASSLLRELLCESFLACLRVQSSCGNREEAWTSPRSYLLSACSYYDAPK